jgi:hypothetical protein
MKKYYLKIKSGEQDCEIRPYDNKPGWNHKHVYPNREIAPSNGYQKNGRLLKIITKTIVTTDLEQHNIPQWHIDAVCEIYGKNRLWMIAFFEDKK